MDMTIGELVMNLRTIFQVSPMPEDSHLVGANVQVGTHTLSIQVGLGNYTSNRVVFGMDFRNPPPIEKLWQSRDAEIASWDAEGNWYDFGRDRVAGWQSAEDIINHIKVLLDLQTLDAPAPLLALTSG